MVEQNRAVSKGLSKPFALLSCFFPDARFLLVFIYAFKCKIGALCWFGSQRRQRLVCPSFPPSQGLCRPGAAGCLSGQLGTRHCYWTDAGPSRHGRRRCSHVVTVTGERRRTVSVREREKEDAGGRRREGKRALYRLQTSSSGRPRAGHVETGTQTQRQRHTHT